MEIHDDKKPETPLPWYVSMVLLLAFIAMISGSYYAGGEEGKHAAVMNQVYGGLDKYEDCVRKNKLNK